MYNPPEFAEHRLDVLHAFIREHPLAALVSCGFEGLDATHVPVVLHSEIGPQGLLRCHMARANPQWKTLQSSRSVLAILRGPDHYITPSWYPSTKEHGKVVPTWNYVAVHVWGRAQLFEDEPALIRHVKELTRQNEAHFERPWEPDDAPREFVSAMVKAIVGIEIAIDRIEGKWKASQNRSPADREGVVEGLQNLNTAQSLEMAEIVKQRNR